MIKDIIRYNNKEYQLSTVNINGCFETMLFPIENGVISGNEVYMCRVYSAAESHNEHKNIYYHPEKYLSEAAIAEYLKSKEEDFEEEEKILFPWQYMKQYLLGERNFDDAVTMTIEEVYRLIGEYVDKHK